MQAVAQANLNQPRYAATREPTCVDCGCRVRADWTKTNANGEATVDRTRSVRRGSGDGMHEQTRCLNWGPTRGHRFPRTKTISRGKTASGSDEAIVSDDLTGHYNRSTSQGPLDRIASGSVAAKPQGSCPTGLFVGDDERRCWPCISSSERRSRSNSCLKPYWGKPAVRNFRGGRENTVIRARLADA